MLSMTHECYKKLGIPVRIEINNRALLEGLVIASGIDSSNVNRVILSVDKLAKIGEDGVRRELEEYNISKDNMDKLFGYFKLSIEEIEHLSITNENFVKGKNEIRELFSYINALGLDECIFTPYLARGLEIYTGTVWEVFDKSKRISSAIGGGGRYDKIITNFIDDGNEYPAVGISFGIVPICELLKNDDDNTVCDVLVVPINTNCESLVFSEKLRRCGIKTVIEMNGRKLKKVLESASKNNIPYVIIIGEDEINKGIIQIKDMISSTKTDVSINDIEKICEIIKK